MKKSKLLLLDANVVIELFKQGIWDKVIERYDVHLSRTVAEDEAHFYETPEGDRHDFDLSAYVTAQRVTVFDVTPCQLKAFLGQFSSEYIEKLDAGESESLVHLLSLTGECKICSADKIVYRILGNFRISERGISLEEVLQQAGLGRVLPRQFSKSYCEEWSKKGFEEGMRGIGSKK